MKAGRILPGIIFLSAIISPARIVAQTGELTVGDRVPDLVIRNIINYDKGMARLSDFKGKIIIIDFWGKYCSSCIVALSKIDSLQKLFKGKIQVITVSDHARKEDVWATLGRFKLTRNIKLPVVINDSRLKKYFPHEIVSHVVWIDGRGIVRAITGAEYIDSANIQRMLDGNKVEWAAKRDVVGYDNKASFLDFTQGDIVHPSFLYYSAITGYLEGISPPQGRVDDSSRNVSMTSFYNYDLLSLTRLGLDYRTGVVRKQIILEVKDTSRYIRAANSYFAEWAKRNLYCYSIILPLTISIEETEKIVREDITHWLDRLGIVIKKENRIVNCLVLTVKSEERNNTLKTKGGNYRNELDDPGSIKRLLNSPLSGLAAFLNDQVPDIPWVFDETGIPDTLKVDLELNIDSFKNIPALSEELKRYGIELRQAKREMEMYIITEKG